MVIVSSDYADVATPTELSVQRPHRATRNLGAPVVLSVRHAAVLPPWIPRSSRFCLGRFAPSMRILPPWYNRVTRREARAWTQVYVLPESPPLVAPTVADPCRAVGGTLQHGIRCYRARGDGNSRRRDDGEHCLERLGQGFAGDHIRGSFRCGPCCAERPCGRRLPSLSTMIINGGPELPLDRGTGVRPSSAASIIATELSTFDTANAGGRRPRPGDRGLRNEKSTPRSR